MYVLNSIYYFLTQVVESTTTPVKKLQMDGRNAHLVEPKARATVVRSGAGKGDSGALPPRIKKKNVLEKKNY